MIPEWFIEEVRARVDAAEAIGRRVALRKSGAIGENNRGFTEVRQNVENASSISSAENRDREAVYAAIAKEQGTSAETVGRVRARQIANNSAAGVWLQRESGEWYQK